MNQIGFVEISHIKNDLLYRALLPMGVPWTDVHEVLLVLAGQVTDIIKENDEQERLKKEQEAATPIEVPVLDAEIASS